MYSYEERWNTAGTVLFVLLGRKPYDKIIANDETIKD